MYLVLAFMIVVNVVVGSLLHKSETTLANIVIIQQVSAEETGNKKVIRVNTSDTPTPSTATCPDGTIQSCLTINSKTVVTCPDGGNNACTPAVILTSVNTCNPSCGDDR